jgi:multicomponent Na+:H+ antiporter subunit F
MSHLIGYPTAITGVMILLVFALVLAFFRLVRGPSLADRVVAFDLITLVSVGILATYAIASDQDALLDVAIILALITFVATVAFSRFIIERGAQPPGGSP